MAKRAAWAANLTVNSVGIEDESTSISLEVSQEVIDVNGFSNTGPERVVGNYGHSLKIDGNADFASGQGDATLFGMLGSSGVTVGFDPTGASAGTNDPNYDSTYVLESYSITAAVGASVKYSSQLQGAAALVRATS